MSAKKPRLLIFAFQDGSSWDFSTAGCVDGGGGRGGARWKAVGSRNPVADGAPCDGGERERHQVGGAGRRFQWVRKLSASG